MRVVSLTKGPCAFYRGNMAYGCRLSITFIHHIEAFQLHRPQREPPETGNEIAENLIAGLSLSKGNPMVFIHPLARPAISGGGGIRDTLGGANDCPFCQLKPLHLQPKNEASKNDFKLFIPHKFRTCSYINKQTCMYVYIYNIIHVLFICKCIHNSHSPREGCLAPCSNLSVSGVSHFLSHHLQA